MIGILATLYSAMVARQRAYDRYLDAKLGRVHLTDQLTPRMALHDRSAWQQRDESLIIQANEALKTLQEARDQEEKALAQYHREMRTAEYRTALGYLG